MQTDPSSSIPISLELLVFWAVLFLGVLYWAFGPGRGKKGPEKIDGDGHEDGGG